MSRRQRRPRRHMSTHSMLNAKKRKKISCWNARTLNEVGRTAVLTAEMRKNNPSIFGVSKLRLFGHGRLRTSMGKTAAQPNKSSSCVTSPNRVFTVEWHTSLFVNFVDFEKAIDSLARERI